MSGKTHFTEVQQAALERAYEILGEHFDGCLIGVIADVEVPGSEEQQESVRVYYAGGRTLALGLACQARLVIEGNMSREKDAEP